MARFSRTLGYGRGEYKGVDKSISQSESYDARARSIATQTGWMFSPFGFHDAVQSALTANRLYFVMAPRVADIHSLYYARMYISSSVANTFMHGAIYAYSTEPVKSFSLLAGSYVKFNAGSTGVKQATLTSPIDILPEKQYFFGVLSENALIQVDVMGPMASTINLRFLESSQYNPLPSSVLLSATSVLTDIVMPDILYVSQDGSNVI